MLVQLAYQFSQFDGPLREGGEESKAEFEKFRIISKITKIIPKVTKIFLLCFMCGKLEIFVAFLKFSKILNSSMEFHFNEGQSNDVEFCHYKIKYLNLFLKIKMNGKI